MSVKGCVGGLGLDKWTSPLSYEGELNEPCPEACWPHMERTPGYTSLGLSPALSPPPRMNIHNDENRHECSCLS